MNLPNKKNPYAIITGGSSGIGLAFTHQLAEKGYNICIVSNQQEELRILENEIAIKYEVKCVSLFIDLAKSSAAQEVYTFCKERKLQIEVFINNAGYLITEEIVNVIPHQITSLLNLHVLTPTLLSQLFAIDMIADRKGYILTVSSTSAYMTYPLISIYGPSKSYLCNFTKSMRNELYSKNINVCGVLPGAVDTSLFKLSPSKRKLAKRLRIMHSPEFIAKKGLNALFKNKGTVVPGILNKLGVNFLKVIPDFIIRKIFDWWDHSKLNNKNRIN